MSRKPHPAGVKVYDAMRLETADLVAEFADDIGLTPDDEELLHGLIKRVRVVAYLAGVNACQAIEQANRNQGD